MGLSQRSPVVAAAELTHFLRHGALGNGTLICSGAGISTASGIPDYRGPHGVYKTAKYGGPMRYEEFIKNEAGRRRYWARSFLGWDQVKHARPNAAHFAITWLLNQNICSHLITQNVDGLHLKAGVSESQMTELHGALRFVKCLSCHKSYDREKFQTELQGLNPQWTSLISSKKIKIKPDGDVDILDADYQQFRYPSCSNNHDLDRSGILKPDVVFFGENIHHSIKDKAEEKVLEADQLLVIGSTLTTYSSYRLLRLAHEHHKRIALVNIGGKIRGEELLCQANGDIRIEAKAEIILPQVLELMA